MAISKRTHKPDPTPSIKNLTEADDTLRRLGELDGQIGAIEKFAADEIKAIQRRQADDAEAMIAERKMLARELELFSREHYGKGGFGDKRAMELPSGFIGFRRSTSVKWIHRKVEDVIAAIRAVSRATRLGKLLAENESQIIKIKESPVKPAIRALGLSDEDYARIGVRIESSDTFAYSTDKTREFDLSEQEDAA